MPGPLTWNPKEVILRRMPAQDLPGFLQNHGKFAIDNSGKLKIN